MIMAAFIATTSTTFPTITTAIKTTASTNHFFAVFLGRTHSTNLTKRKRREIKKKKTKAIVLL